MLQGSARGRASSRTSPISCCGAGEPVVRMMISARMLAPHLALRMSPARYLGAKQLSLQRRCGFCTHSVHAASRQPKFLRPQPLALQNQAARRGAVHAGLATVPRGRPTRGAHAKLHFGARGASPRHRLRMRAGRCCVLETQGKHGSRANGAV